MENYEFLYNKNHFIEQLSRSFVKHKNLHYDIIMNGIILPNEQYGKNLLGGILRDDGIFIEGTHLHRGLGGKYEFFEEGIQYHDEDVVYLGMWANIWGHCFTDNIRRIWILNNKKFRLDIENLKFVYCTLDNNEIGENFKQLLSILGINESVNIERINSISRYRKIILPDECFWYEKNENAYVYTDEYKKLLDKIREFGEKKYTPLADKKIYFSYRKAGSYRQIGEKKLEKFFVNHGYRIIAPEEHSFYEQLNILQNCEEFASTIGSCSHNIVFLRNKTKVCLIPRAYYINGYQQALNRIHDLDITYVDTNLSYYVDKNTPWAGPFYYFISDQLQQFMRCKKIKNFKIPKFEFFLYRILGCTLNEKIDPPEYLINEGKKHNTPFIPKKNKSVYSFIHKSVLFLYQKIQKNKRNLF